MCKNVGYLHSHSILEGNMNFSKGRVLIDEEYAPMFADIQHELKPFNFNKRKYYSVPILAFVHKGGRFKRFDA